jgi:3-oxoisoapionate decarboxylase
LRWSGDDVLHTTLVDLDNDVSAEHLAEVNAAARGRGLDLELNVSIDAPCDPRVNASVEESLHIGHAIGAQLVKFSLDVKRPKPIYGSCIIPTWLSSWPIASTSSRTTLRLSSTMA